MSNYPFWRGEKFTINSRKLVSFLSEDLGFGLYKSIDGRDTQTTLIRQVNHMVQIHSAISLKRSLTEHIETDDALGDDEKDGILDRLVKLQPATLSNYANHLPLWSQEKFQGTKHLDVMTDTKDFCYLPFKNGVVVISKDEITLKDYDILGSRVVWESSVIEHSIELKNQFSREAFRHFVHFALKSDINPQKDDLVNRYDEGTDNSRYRSSKDAFETGYGYLIHNFNPPDEQKMVVFVDVESTASTAQGRNGKSLTQKTLENYKRMVTINGKGLRNSSSEGSRFNFQGVKVDTQIVVINDLKQNFDFEQFFSQITDDFTIEGKGKNQIVIPQERKPKMCLNTNYVIQGSGASYEGRQHIVEFGNYFNKCHGIGLKPKDIIGCLVCDSSFDKDDWDAFYSYGFRCVQRYLKEGLHQSKCHSHRRNGLIELVEGAEGSGEFTRWLENWCKTTRVEFNYHKKGISEQKLLNMFRQDKPELAMKWDDSKFHSAVFQFATNANGYDYNPQKSTAGNTRTSRRWRKGGEGSQENYVLITHTDDVPEKIIPVTELVLVSNTVLSNTA